LPNIRETKTLASTLPDFTFLQHLILNTRKDDVMAIRCSLKAWPPPLLKLHGHTLGLMRHWQALALPEEATAWEDRRILEHWKV